MKYKQPNRSSITGTVEPLRPMTQKEYSTVWHIIDECGLSDVLEVKENLENGIGYHITATWKGDRCMSRTAANLNFATALATAFTSAEMKDIGFNGSFDIADDSWTFRAQHLTVAGSDVFCLNTKGGLPFDAGVHGPAEKTKIEPLVFRSYL